MEKKYPDRNHGKQTKQRLKPYIVLQYLLRNTDEEHFATGKDIEAYRREICDIYAERRSIYKDIDEINEVNWMFENDTDIFEAEESITKLLHQKIQNRIRAIKCSFGCGKLFILIVFCGGDIFF